MRLATVTLEKVNTEVTTLSDYLSQLEAAVASEPTSQARENSLQQLRIGMEAVLTDMDSAGSLGGSHSSLPLPNQAHRSTQDGRPEAPGEESSIPSHKKFSLSSVFSGKQCKSGIVTTPSLNLSVATSNVCTLRRKQLRQVFGRSVGAGVSTRAAELFGSAESKETGSRVGLASPCTKPVPTPMGPTARRYGCSTVSRSLSRNLFPSTHVCCASRCALMTELYTSSPLTRPQCVLTLWTRMLFGLSLICICLGCPVPLLSVA